MSEPNRQARQARHNLFNRRFLTYFEETSCKVSVGFLSSSVPNLPSRATTRVGEESTSDGVPEEEVNMESSFFPLSLLLVSHFTSSCLSVMNEDETFRLVNLAASLIDSTCNLYLSRPTETAFDLKAAPMVVSRSCGIHVKQYGESSTAEKLIIVVHCTLPRSARTTIAQIRDETMSLWLRVVPACLKRWIDGLKKMCVDEEMGKWEGGWHE